MTNTKGASRKAPFVLTWGDCWRENCCRLRLHSTRGALRFASFRRMIFGAPRLRQKEEARIYDKHERRLPQGALRAHMGGLLEGGTAVDYAFILAQALRTNILHPNDLSL
jgi:hypothetical protein